MRTSYLIGISLALLNACTSVEIDGDLASLVEERTQLKAQVDSLNERITFINKTLAENEDGFEQSLTLVETTLVEPTSFAHYFEIYGEVETDKNVLLYPEMGGLINSISVKEGQRVSKGTVLAAIDSQIIRNQISEVETSYSLAKTTFEKQERLWKQNIGSEMQYLQAKNQKESLESTLSTLNSQLSKTRVRAPFSGVVDEIIPNTGEMANPQMPIMRIVNLDRMYIKSDVSEQHLQTVTPGTPVQIELPSIGKTIEAKVSESSKYINPENRSFKVRVDLPRNGADLRPNQLAHMKINDYRAENVIVLPSSIVMQTSEGKDFVFTLEEKEGKTMAKKVFVDTGLEYDGMIEIKGGLEKDMRVISKGAQSVRDGQRVRLTRIS